LNLTCPNRNTHINVWQNGKILNLEQNFMNKRSSMRKDRSSHRLGHWLRFLGPRRVGALEISVWWRTNLLRMIFGGESKYCSSHYIYIYVWQMVLNILNCLFCNLIYLCIIVLWRGSPNIEMDEHSFMVNRERAVDYLNSLDKVISLLFSFFWSSFLSGMHR